MYNKSTRARSNYKTRVVTLDSKNAFTNLISYDKVEWINYLAEPLVLTGPTEIYLESIYIGGYKINPSTYHASSPVDNGFAWEPTFSVSGQGGNIYYFSIGIPEFEIKTVSSEGGGGLLSNGSGRDLSNNMSNRFNLCQEPALVSSHQPTGTDTAFQGPLRSEQKPFILGHLSKEAVFVSKINATTLNKITVNIQDQDGRSIWGKGGPRNSGNPESRFRRVFMQFTLIEQKVN